MNAPRHKVIIIGSGPAGLTAAIYAARANLKPLCVEGFNAGGLIPGGQLMFTSDVENFPGFPKSVTGQELMGRFREQAEHQGTEFITADVQKVDFSERPFKVWVGEDENVLHLADTIIIATGARANYLGLDSEHALKNKGVSACAVCDGALFRRCRSSRRWATSRFSWCRRGSIGWTSKLGPSAIHERVSSLPRVRSGRCRRSSRWTRR